LSVFCVSPALFTVEEEMLIVTVSLDGTLKSDQAIYPCGDSVYDLDDRLAAYVQPAISIVRMAVKNSSLRTFPLLSINSLPSCAPTLISVVVACVDSP
ncbi:MAG TPA: hypothetical protein DEV97_05660, partial [Lachnospiraceae bacterium]|nr:hypothetical protein [Lachnospiraceae bacterium]